jgi:predicted ATPase/signal transduction histidine kinase
MLINIPEYQVLEKIYESSNSHVYRGIRQQDSLPVILKILNTEFPTSQVLSRYKLEYEITRSLDSDLVIRTYDLQRCQNGFVIILEDFGGKSLAEILESRKLSLVEFLALAMQICEGVGEVHAANIIHKDINPSNIVLNPETQQLKVIDFGIASALTKETLIISHNQVLEGTLNYISPEQTGRMNRSLDYRTDIYSMGVTFYQMLTDRLPFESNDPLELIHYHLALEPIAPHLINPQIPLVLSEIILKLLAKTAEERYQSVWGVKADLERCLHQLQDQGEIEPFVLAEQDIADKFLVSEKLYGRANEVESLLAAFARIADAEVGNSKANCVEMILVSGYSGIGKSSLVQEIYKPIAKSRGYFISGKFDQYQRNIPYFAIIQAFQGLIKQLLTEDVENLEQWRSQLIAALGTNSQTITQVIPSLEMIIGKQADQSPMANISASEAQNRFNRVLQKFIRVFAQSEHPLVIFLDDLQWADRASLKLLEILATTSESQSLLLIGAYRDNEVNAAHPIMQMIANIQQNGVLNQLYLSELNLTDINQLIADTLHCSATDSLSLAELVQQKTGGNPFFMNEFLKDLYGRDLLRFDYRSRQWQWLITEIQEQEITDNVVSLMAGKLQKLSDRTQRVLQISACIGNQFDIDILALTSETSAKATAHSLEQAISEGLIVSLNNAHKALRIGVTISETDGAIAYRFVHDRIQQAAYSLLNSAQKSSLHYKIGCLLASKLKISESLSEVIEQNRNQANGQNNGQIFTITSQLNLGIEQIVLHQERDRLAYLNLLAARKARYAYAYESAARYAEIGLQILTDDLWLRQPNVTLDLHLEAAKASALIGEFERSDQLVAMIFAQITDVLERIKAVDIQIQSLIARNDLAKAIAVALDSLNQLGVEIPEQPTPEIVASAFTQIRQQLATNQNVSDLPAMTDYYKLAAMNILANMASAAYIGAPSLYPLIVLKQIELSLEYGNTPETAYAFSTYGLILCINGEIAKGNHCADVAIALLEKFQALSFKAKIFNLVYHFVRPWQEPIRNAIAPLLEGYQSGLESGDTEFAAYCAFNHCQLAYFAGENLQQVNQDMQIYAEAIAKLNQNTALIFHQIGQQSALNWLSEAENPQNLVGAVYNINERLPQHLAAGDQYSISSANAHQLILYYHFGQPHEAIAIAKQTEQTNAGIGGTFLLSLSYFYHALALLAIADHTTELDSPSAAKITEDLAKLEHWATHAPQNFAHKCLLIRAEQARVLGDPLQACDLYDQAIALAKENAYIQEEALANELAAKFYLNLGKDFIAKAYMKEARYCYLKWGSVAKVQYLEKRYSDILGTRPIDKTLRKIVRRSTSTQSNNLEALDLEAVLRSSHAIASEIKLDQLLTTLMNTLIESAGAQTGYLLLPKDLANSSNQDQWCIEAIKNITYQNVFVMQSLPMDSISVDGITYVPISLVNYVARTQESIVLNKATQDGDFQNDPWIVQYQSKSLLCMPLLNQGSMTAIVLLENNLVTDAFTPERIKILNLLSTQAAISIVKSRLLQQQAELNQSLQAEICDRQLAQQALQEQNQRTQLFADVSLKIRQSIELKEILQTTVTEIQKILQSDRVVIYQINPDKTGQIVEESVVHSCRSLINQEIFDPCFASCVDQYAQGKISSINNVDDSIAKPCHIDFLKQFEVKANLVIPILQTDQIWGLLIVHQCDRARYWSDFEMEFLAQLANQVGIALLQSQLVTNLRQNEHLLHQLNEGLEHRVTQRTAQLEVANKELESFSYSVSHDLRAPLRAIDGFSRILQEDYSDRLDKEGTRYLKIVRDNAKRMGELIDDLLNLSRWNRKELVRRAIVVNDLIQQVFSDLQSEIKDRQIQLMIADLPNCEADNSLLMQVWINLISNAIKYTSKTENARIEIGYQIIDAQGAYFIRDNGAGFDMQYADKLFGVFQRMHLEKDFEGTGIGLAIVQRIIQRHGGTVWAEAAIAQGATFYFTIPNPSLNSL